jgi:hypothetical protein
VKKKVLEDISLECDYPGYVGRYERTMEGRARALEEWAHELVQFIRDHRSRDDISLSVKRIYEEQCGFCGCEWESALDDEGCPVCCDAAMKEWETTKTEAGAVASNTA